MEKEITKNKKICFRVTQDEFDNIKENAENANMSMSAYMLSRSLNNNDTDTQFINSILHLTKTYQKKKRNKNEE
jgi:DNA primase large subunit